MLVAALLLVVGSPPAYFPRAFERISHRCRFAGRLRPEAIMLPYERQWYGGVLAAAEEQPLYSAATAGTAMTVRFLWLRSFDAPVVVRVTQATGGRTWLVTTKLTGQGGLPPGRIIRQTRRLLSASETGVFHAMLGQTGIIAVPPKRCIDGLMLDGTQWIIETAGPTGYSYAMRESPQDGAVHRVGRHMLKLTGWRFGAIY